jgi:hypothetical protein
VYSVLLSQGFIRDHGGPEDLPGRRLGDRSRLDRYALHISQLIPNTLPRKLEVLTSVFRRGFHLGASQINYLPLKTRLT